jgi:superfamily II DNA helicase RecQ
MSMKITFSTQDLTESLHISLTGSRIVFSGFTDEKTISIEEAAGQVAVSVSAVEAVQPVMEEVAPVPQVQTLPDSQEVQVVDVTKGSDVPFSGELFNELVLLRRKIATELNFRPYFIFHDSTLKEMCRTLPCDLQELRKISGVGESKIVNYGPAFLEVIRSYVSAYEVGA